MNESSEKHFEQLLRKRLKDSLERNEAANCPDENRVSAYLEGVLPHNERTDFERHLAQCARCHDELSLLLRSDATDSVAPATQAKQEVKTGWTWFLSFGFKPVLAVLAVTIVSGYVGFELLQRESRQRESAAEVAQSLSQKGGVEDEKSLPPARQQTAAPEITPVEPRSMNQTLEADRETGIRSHKKVAGEPSAPPVSGFSKDSQQRSLRDAFSSVPPEAGEAGANTRLGSKSDLLAKQSVPSGIATSAPAPQASPTKASDKSGGAVNALTVRHNAALPDPAVTPSPPVNRPALIGPQASPEEENRSKKNLASTEPFLQKTETRHLEADGLVDSGKLKQEPLVRSKASSPEGRIDEVKKRQLTVAGKTFELRNNVWTDTSISEDASETEVVIYKDSSDYADQTKSLADYRSLLTRNEDCRIKFQGKVYYIKGSQR
jgi:hypothetical protein